MVDEADGYALLRMFGQTRALSMQAQIASRVVAIILTAFPLAGVGLAFDQQERDLLAAFPTYEELRAYVESYLLSSYWACFGLVLVAGFAYLSLIEGIALLLRLGLARARRQSPKAAA